MQRAFAMSWFPGVYMPPFHSALTRRGSYIFFTRGRSRRDGLAKKDAVLAWVVMPRLRVRGMARYDVGELARKIDEALAAAETR